MSTSQSTIDYIVEQLSELGDVSARKMFGEYALYCHGKVVGLVCNDLIYIKITEPGKQYVGTCYQEGIAYPGAKASMLIDGDRVEDREWFVTLIQITAEAIPFPKPKKRKQS